jgi:hypothetical protein
MRDDRYRGTTLPRPVQKLCRMAEREADRDRPERLCEQAVTALRSDAGKEISPEFRRRLREHDASPGFFDASEFTRSACFRLEAEIARVFEAHPGIGSVDATCEALRRLGESYAREQQCTLIADRDPDASIVLASVARAFDEAAPIAARLVLNGEAAPRVSDRVRLDENLLVQPSSGTPP